VSRRKTAWTRMLVFAIPILASISIVATLRADDPPPNKKGEAEKAEVRPPTAEELSDTRMVFMKSALGHFSIQVGNRKQPATVLDPCLRWSVTNGAYGLTFGVVSVYSYKGGRPAAVGKFFKNGQNRWVNQFTIVPDSDVSIQRGDREFWKPSEFVCKFADLPDSPVPAAKPALRLAQMRSIAADLKVVDHFGVNNPVKESLRLLTQPGYRYSEEGSILDGALFFFVKDTNPECCLLIECTSSDKGSRYRYAVAPMSIFQLAASYKDKEVWSIDARDAGPNNTAYYAWVYTPEPGEKLPE
jgi:hypothetical protein